LGFCFAADEVATILTVFTTTLSGAACSACSRLSDFAAGDPLSLGSTIMGGFCFMTDGSDRTTISVATPIKQMSENQTVLGMGRHRRASIE